MVLSRWGDRVEGLQTKLTLGEEVSIRARMAELEQVCSAMREWVERRISAGKVVVEYTDRAFDIRVTREFKNLNDERLKAVARIIVSEREVDAHVSSTGQWSNFMDKISDRLAEQIRGEMRKNQAAPDWPGAMANASHESMLAMRDMNRLNNATIRMGADISQMTEKLNRALGIEPPISQEDEDRAIESIRRAMGG